MHSTDPAPDRMNMQAVPNAGDLKRAHAIWRFGRHGESGTRLQLDAAIAPDFWATPLIRPNLIARELRHTTQVTGEAIAWPVHCHARNYVARF